MLQRLLSARLGQLALNDPGKKGPLVVLSRVMVGNGLGAAVKAVNGGFS